MELNHKRKYIQYVIFEGENVFNIFIFRVSDNFSHLPHPLDVFRREKKIRINIVSRERLYTLLRNKQKKPQKLGKISELCE